MRVVFLRGYQGKLTGERWYDAGMVAEVEDIAAQRLAQQGVVERLPPPDLLPEPEASALPRRSSKRKDERC